MIQQIRNQSKLTFTASDFIRQVKRCIDLLWPMPEITARKIVSAALKFSLKLN